MNDHTTSWNKQELSAYLLLYCANVNFSETEEEIALIRAKVNSDSYKSIHKEFEKDNDYQSISKIKTAIDRLGYSEGQIDDLIGEVKTLFLSDGNFDQSEKTLFFGLKKLLE